MNYKSVIVTDYGGPEVMQVVENELRPPTRKEVRVRVLAVPVCLPDVQARYGQTPVAPKPPFTLGYAIVGDVEAVGADVKTAVIGDRVAALTVFGGYSEVIYLTEDKLIPMPATLDPAEASTLILNYIVAYQTLHRSAKVKAGDKILIIGASGGVGTALLDLGKLAGLKMYGIASARKHDVLTQYGATPIDYHTQNFVDVINKLEPNGLDAVIDGIGGDYVDRGLPLLATGGTWVSYGNPLSFSGLVKLLSKLVWFNLTHRHKSMKVYGTTTSRFGKRPFLEDWPKLFHLLETRQIEPIIMQKFSILEAAAANEVLESGNVIGNVVLVNS